MDNRELVDNLVNLAEIDLAYPYSLMMDAWDILEDDGKTDVSRKQFEVALSRAILNYRDNPLEYILNERVPR